MKSEGAPPKRRSLAKCRNIFHCTERSLRQVSDVAGAVLRQLRTVRSPPLARLTAVTIAGMSTGDKTIRRIPAALRYCDMASLTFLLKRMGLDQTRIWRRRARKALTARLVIGCVSSVSGFGCARVS